jgi:hypothetical protein
MSNQVSKRELLSKHALAAGLGVGALALLAQAKNASADTPFTNFPFAATGAPSLRTMPDRLSETKNVKDFGAIGDGRHDDTTAIQSAVNWTSGPNRGTIYFPPGTYLVSSPITFNDAFSIIFRGEIGLSTIVGNFSGYILDRSPPYNPTGGLRIIEKLNIMNGNPAGGAIRLGSTVGGSIRDCSISAVQGIVLTDPSTGGTQSVTVESCTFMTLANWPAGSNGIVTSGNTAIIACDFSGFETAVRCYSECVNIIGGRIEHNITGVLLGLNMAGANQAESFFFITGTSFESNGTAINFAGGCGYSLITGVGIIAFESNTIPGGHPYGIRIGNDAGKFAVFAGISVSGQFDTASISVGNSTDRSGLTFISVACGNGSTRGGVPWQLPTTAHTAQFINCNIVPIYTFASLPTGANVFEGDQFDISDSPIAAPGNFASKVMSGGGANHVRVRWNAQTATWTVCG